MATLPHEAANRANRQHAATMQVLYASAACIRNGKTLAPVVATAVGALCGCRYYMCSAAALACGRRQVLLFLGRMA